MSCHIRQWEIGSSAQWRGPFGGLNYSPNKVCTGGPFGGLNYSPNKVCTGCHNVTLLAGEAALHYRCLFFLIQYTWVGMLACGTGIAPMLQLIRAVVENEAEDTIIHLVYGCRTQHDILLKEQLDCFASYWNFTAFYALSQSSAESLASDRGLVRFGDRVHFGRINSSLVAMEMAPASDDKSVVLICGTKSFDKDMINYLSKAGYSKDKYFKF